DKSIDFTLYKKDGTVYRHGFDKQKLGSGEWKYSAWFSAPEACYVLETPMAGYQIRYENVGVYAQVTDRCCDGGTITIHKVPKTGDTANLALWMSMVVIGALTLCGVAVLGKRRKQSEK
ncbi:MAG: LPXTG cell wall anchor domain-containing protein, partial [Clostridia bacterium]|nr:LPXTG cell wall anchor domain-containing protein [Clostridia bacterium]